ncbi:MAG: hypothetical protein DRP50_08100 [Thermotoga sp.]|nr:MAG: hypothetical protein DRP50_08100 [Thermotoga sp.]
MSGKYPVVPWERITKALEKLGYEKASQKGSHMKYRIKGKSIIIVPRHKRISIGVLKQIVHEVTAKTGLSEKEFIDLIK